MSGFDTIAAIATAPGRSGVAVVRVSGSEALELGERLTGIRPEAGRIRFARLRDPETGAVVDETVMLAFAAPHSYTGEDVVEFQCHGGEVTPRRVLGCCLRAGARMARRGEFTERAYLNGKLDYAQAESVLDLIDAKTERAAEHALQGLSGERTHALRDFYDRALAISCELEHALDVDESDLPRDFLARQLEAIRELRQAMSEALRHAREGRILRRGALVVLAGPPNVGKSSLMNALLKENRAIVSATPGTTRDVIEEWLDLDGWPVRLVDTAGLRQTDDDVEAEGVRRAEALIAQADVVLRLIACDEQVPAPVADDLVVYTKSDLLPPDQWPASGIVVSAHSGSGIDRLRERIVERLRQLADRGAGDEGEALDIAGLAEVLSRFGRDLPEDPVLLGNVIRSVADHLGTLVGARYGDDLLERLFSRFCVGK